MIVGDYHRKPYAGSFNMEGVFAAVCEALPHDFHARA
jgi:hypothetical protein